MKDEKVKIMEKVIKIGIFKKDNFMVYVMIKA
jgi:hypothetical protein